MSTDNEAPQNKSEEEVKETKESTPKKKGKKRLWLWIPLGIFILLAVGGYSFYEYSNTAEFCNSCHIMEPYVEAWAHSNHADVNCIECHIAPRDGAKWEAKVQGMMQAIKYLTRSYASKPYAEIEDASCLRSGCHDQRLVEEHGTETFKNNVSFDHTPHLTQVRRGKQLRCTSCHAQMVIGNHMEVTTTTCNLCHFRESDKHDVVELSDCQLCHKKLPDYDVEHKVVDPHQPDIVLDTTTFNHLDYQDKNVTCTSCHGNMIQGKGVARQDRCLVCHNEPKHLDRFNEIEFIHDNHITEHNVTCERCHDAIKHKITPMPTTNEGRCQSCHVSLHDGQRIMYVGTGSQLVEEKSPSVMYSAMVHCTGCHMVKEDDLPETTKFSGFTKVINYDACKECHSDAPDAYVEMFNDMKDSVKADFEETMKLRKSVNTDGIEAEVLAKIDHDLDFVEHSLGWAHNYDYTSTIIEAINDLLSSR